MYILSVFFLLSSPFIHIVCNCIILRRIQYSPLAMHSSIHPKLMYYILFFLSSLINILLRLFSMLFNYFIASPLLLNLSSISFNFTFIFLIFSPSATVPIFFSFSILHFYLHIIGLYFYILPSFI